MNVWFSSDWHLGHKNIIKYSNRPFLDTKQMNEALIRNWNAVVGPADDAYMLGDFSFESEEKTIEYVKRLNGNLRFIFGNHDKALRKNQAFLKEWIWAKDFAEIDVEGKKVVLCHYAMRTWNQSHRGSFQLYGHSHNSLPEDPNSLSFDVGVDAQNYAPISWEQVKNKMAKKTWRPIDHHGQKDL